ncbi:MAG TPA: hypothetical protein VFE79_17300 [Paraburkholderia sp.]|nr:hypothetical protein [Paraburkholderia sp.]
MTVPSNLSSTPSASAASVPVVRQPANSGSSSATSPMQKAASQAAPSLPSGLIGHHVNTTA